MLGGLGWLGDSETRKDDLHADPVGRRTLGCLGAVLALASLCVGSRISSNIAAP